MPDLIKSPADYPTPANAPSGIDSIGTGDGVPIEGNKVVLTYSPGEVGASVPKPLSSIPDSK